MKHTLLISALLAAGLAHAATGPEFNPKHLSQDVKVLASDEFEGLGPNTAGETKTVNYLVEQFKAAGMQPGGDPVKGKKGERSWTQAALGTDHGRCAWRMWETTVDLEPGEQEIVVRAWDSSAATQPEAEAGLWNPKGYVNNARPRIRVTAR